jgi:hypothetical protein
MPTQTVRLRALAGKPLADAELRRTVIAAAHALAEREGLRLDDVRADDVSITARVRGGPVEAVGFAAELRRTTDAWYARKYDVGPLWGGTGRETVEE